MSPFGLLGAFGYFGVSGCLLGWFFLVSVWLPSSAYLPTKMDAYMLGKCFQELATRHLDDPGITDMLSPLVHEHEERRPPLRDFSAALGALGV